MWFKLELWEKKEYDAFMTPYFSFALFVGSLSRDGKLWFFLFSFTCLFTILKRIEEKSFQDFHKQSITTAD